VPSGLLPAQPVAWVLQSKNDNSTAGMNGIKSNIIDKVIIKNLYCINSPVKFYNRKYTPGCDCLPVSQGLNNDSPNSPTGFYGWVNNAQRRDAVIGG